MRKLRSKRTNARGFSYKGLQIKNMTSGKLLKIVKSKVVLVLN
jgi:hypothetical protein